jgi:hypothetical protein
MALAELTSFGLPGTEVPSPRLGFLRPTNERLLPLSRAVE